MQRRRSAPHTFEDYIAAEKARCEEQLTNTPQGPARDALVKKIRQLDRKPYERLAVVPGAPKPGMILWGTVTFGFT